MPLPVVENFEFGRAEECHVRINSPKASRRHAAIHAQKHAAGSEYCLIDLGSSNGTFLNDRRITRSTQLHDGDRIRIADEVFVFRQKDGTADDGPIHSTHSTIRELRTGPGWLLVSDVVDSTPLVKKMPPDQLATLLARWLRASTEVIEQGGGIMNEVRGDGYLAHWGGAVGDCDRVVATILKLRTGPASLPFRIALHYGEFTTTTESVLGSERLIGQSVYFVFRLERVAEANQRTILFSAAAHEMIGDRLPLVRMPGEFELKGFEGKHVVYTLEDQKPQSS